MSEQPSGDRPFGRRQFAGTTAVISAGMGLLLMAVGVWRLASVDPGNDIFFLAGVMVVGLSTLFVTAFFAVRCLVHDPYVDAYEAEDRLFHVMPYTIVLTVACVVAIFAMPAATAAINGETGPDAHLVHTGQTASPESARAGESQGATPSPRPDRASDATSPPTSDQPHPSPTENSTTVPSPPPGSTSTGDSVQANRRLRERERPIPSPAPATRDGSDPDQPAAGSRTACSVGYAVRPGDSLWLIASQLLPPDVGHGPVNTRWQRIYTTNRIVIGSDPDRIFPGSVLEVPLSGCQP